MINHDALRNQPILETARLRLIQHGPEHADQAWSALQDEEAMRLTGTTATFTEDVVRTYLASLPGNPEQADFAVTTTADGAYLGEVVLNQLDTANASMNVRIALTRPAWGHGYGTEATRAVVEYGFEVVGLHRISLSVFAFNPRARRAYEKAGFVREGVLRESHLMDGAWHDDILMSILVHEFRGREA